MLEKGTEVRIASNGRIGIIDSIDGDTYNVLVPGEESAIACTQDQIEEMAQPAHERLSDVVDHMDTFYFEVKVDEGSVNDLLVVGTCIPDMDRFDNIQIRYRLDGVWHMAAAATGAQYKNFMSAFQGLGLQGLDPVYDVASQNGNAYGWNLTIYHGLEKANLSGTNACPEAIIKLIQLLYSYGVPKTLAF